MAFRSDITVNWTLSPRIVTVAAPSTNASVQDIYDTLRVLESSVVNTVYDKIISAGGKEDLGSGTSVGVTATLLNAKISFEARKTNGYLGAVTTTDPLGTTLIDVSASYITSGTIPGALIVNHNDFSLCSTVTVDSESQITTDVLGGGTSNVFTVGDAYTLYPIIQCEIDGGNLVAVDTAGSTIPTVLPTAGTQVILARASTSTVSELQDIQFNSFLGQVTIDETNGVTGIEFPTGTPRRPSNNLTDGLIIAQVRGFNKFFIKDNITIGSGGDYNGFTFEGGSEAKSRIIISSASNVMNCEFIEATVSGTLDGGCEIVSCVVGDVIYVDGFIRDSILSGTVTLSGHDTAHFLDCKSGKPGSVTPTIDMAGSGSALAVRNYSGGIKLINKTSALDSVSLDFSSGQVIIDSSVVSGTIIVRGAAKITNNSSNPSGLNLIDETSGWFGTAATAPSGSVGYNLLQTTMKVEQVNNILYTKTSSVTGTLSNSLIQTGLTEPDNFYNGMSVQIQNSSGIITRRIEAYSQISGTLDVSSDPLPFVPNNGDTVVIMGTYGPSGIGSSGFG